MIIWNTISFVGDFCLDFPFCIMSIWNHVVPLARSSPVAVTSTITQAIALTNHSMLKRASVPASAPQALSFKCITCYAEFDTPRGAACHHCRPNSNGTACADPNSILSVLITPRPDVTAGILRKHLSAPLGTPISVIYCTHPWLPGTQHSQRVDYHLQ